MEVLGIDIGGSGVKAAVVDSRTGDLLSEPLRIPTPRYSTPENIAAVVRELVEQLKYSGPVGCSFPAVIVDGRVLSASNIDDSWIGTRADELFASATGQPFVVHNDADAAGIAEMTLGAGRGLRGTVIMVTIGTGLGSGVFHDGVLIPNTEFGHIPGSDGEPIESFASDRARKVNDLSWSDWGERFNTFLQVVSRVMTPNHFILGGGASKKLDKFEDKLDVDASIHVASFRNNAGIVGAAMAAADRSVGAVG